MSEPETYTDLPIYRLEDVMAESRRLTITELDNAYRIDDAEGKRLAYVYFDVSQFPLGIIYLTPR